MHPYTTPNVRFLTQIMLEICSGPDYSLNHVSGQGHSDLKKVRDAPPSQDGYTY